jgi:MFS family permease
VPGPFYYGWILVLALGITTIISYGTTQYLFGVLLVPIARELGWSRATISGALSVGLVLSGLLGLPIGRAVDRHGARWLMAAGSALAGLTLIALSRVRAPWQFYLLWSGGLGLATALTFYPVSFTVVANWFQRKRGAALALLTLVGGLASPIFIPLAGWLVPRLGWRGTVLALGLVQLAVAVPLHGLVVRRHPEDLGLRPDGEAAPEAPRARLPGGLTLRAALRRPAFWTLTVAASASMLAASALLAHQVAYLIGRGYAGVLAATVAGAVGLASLPGRFVLNVLSDRVGPRGLLALCYAAQAAGVAALLLASSTAWLVAYAAVYGAGFGAVSPLRASVMAEQFGRRAYGSVTAAQGVPAALCAGLGPLLAGRLYDALGTYQLAFALAAGGFLLASLGVALTPPPGGVSAPGR